MSCIGYSVYEKNVSEPPMQKPQLQTAVEVPEGFNLSFFTDGLQKAQKICCSRTHWLFWAKGGGDICKAIDCETEYMQEAEWNRNFMRKITVVERFLQ